MGVVCLCIIIYYAYDRYVLELESPEEACDCEIPDVRLLKEHKSANEVPYEHFSYAGYDRNRYPAWISCMDPRVHLRYVSLAFSKEYQVEKSLLWSWIVFNCETLDILYYSHVKGALTPYDERMLWDEPIRIVMG
jgi:hypothetical protein